MLIVEILAMGPFAYAYAHPILIANQSIIPLDQHIQVFIDPTGQKTIGSMLQLKSTQFIPVTHRRDLHFGYTNQVIWLKIHLLASHDAERVLMFQYPYLDSIELYQVHHGQIINHEHSGFIVPPSQRASNDIHPAFPLQLQGGQPNTLYVRIRAQGSMTVNASLYTPNEFHLASSRMIFFQSLFLGMAMALSLYNLFLGYMLKRLTFLLYSGFISTFAIATMTANGIGGWLLWPVLGPLITRLVPCGFSLAVLWAMLFVRSFLGLKNKMPHLDKFHRFLIGVTVLLSVLSFFLPVQLSVKIMSLLGCSMGIFLIICGMLAVYYKIPAARYYLLAWSCLIVGTVLVSLRNTGWIPSNFMTVYGMEIGSSIEMVLLSFGLASHFNEIERQKRQAQQTLFQTMKYQEQILQERVQEHTQELALAKEKLEIIATHDPLTQLANRRGLNDQFSLIRQAFTQDTFIAVLLIDLDKFKPINDQYGHASGDEVLQIIAQRLFNMCRGEDIVSRLGGDEFAIVLTGFSQQHDLVHFIKRLYKHITSPMQLTICHEIQIDASIGVCVDHLINNSLKQLISWADEAMYQIKHREDSGYLAFDNRIENHFYELNMKHLSDDENIVLL